MYDGARASVKTAMCIQSRHCVVVVSRFQFGSISYDTVMHTAAGGPVIIHDVCVVCNVATDVCPPPPPPPLLLLLLRRGLGPNSITLISS